LILAFYIRGMRIALYGYGKMGKAIEEFAVARGHEVVLRVNASNAGTAPVGADVAIEFSQPEHALANMRICLEHGVPVVAGTTGWYDHLNDVKNLVATTKGSLLWASNFSIGVNLFFRVNRLLAQLDGSHDRIIVFTSMRSTTSTNWMHPAARPSLWHAISI
jgi:4-hydroxy-tetrahydrodipicolinate reductase